MTVPADARVLAADEEIALRPLSGADLEVHARGCDAQIVRWLSDGQEGTAEQHHAWLLRQARAWERGDDVVDLAVVRRGSGEPVGVVGIQRGLPYLRLGQVNLTYAVYPWARGEGVAVRAVRLAATLALMRGPVSEFVIRCDPANEASVRVARRLGLRHLGRPADPEGVLERFEATPGELGLA